MRWQTYQKLMLRDLGEIFGAAAPGVFMSDQALPLKVGIKADLLTMFPNTDNEKLSRWFCLWCRRPEYLKRISVCRYRFNLDGEPVEDVSEIDKTFSAKVLQSTYGKCASTFPGNLPLPGTEQGGGGLGGDLPSKESETWLAPLS